MEKFIGMASRCSDERNIPAKEVRSQGASMGRGKVEGGLGEGKRKGLCLSLKLGPLPSQSLSRQICKPKNRGGKGELPRKMGTREVNQRERVFDTKNGKGDGREHRE